MKKKQALADFKIEKGVKMPSYKTCPQKYPFDELKVGDSFFAKHGVQGSVRHAEKRTGFKFATRTMDGGVRVWRIK